MKEGIGVYIYNEYTGNEGYQYIRPEHISEIKEGCKIRSSLLEGCYGYGNISACDNWVKKICQPDIVIVKKSNQKGIERINLSDREIKILSIKDFYKFHPFIEYMKNGTVIISGEFPEVENWLLSQDINYEKI